MKLTISKKMWLGFSSVLVLLVIVSVLGMFSLFTFTNKYKEIIDVDLQKIDLAKDIQMVQKDMATAVLEYVMFGDEAAKFGDNVSIDKLDKEIEEGTTYAKELIEMTKDEASLQLLEELKVTSVKLFESNEKIISLRSEGNDFTSYAEQSIEQNTKNSRYSRSVNCSTGGKLCKNKRKSG
ncbi:MAG TPA: MCP four helix bundle domain-containing protein [Ureibacillus sp.]|nr:MCP four helix bundle domain-containing protein [Ureibacillus sp.]